jgi:tRNA(Ile2) C34 agmatinyltransferase TiaS
MSQQLIDRANKLKSLVSQMERHNNLNQSDMPLVCSVLMLEVASLMSLVKTIESHSEPCRRCGQLRDDHGTTCQKCRKEMD